MKFATVIVAFVSFCLVSFHSNPAFAAVIDAGDTPASAAIVKVTTRDEKSDGPGRRPRRTLVSKKNPTRGVVSNGDADCTGNKKEQACKGAGGCYWFPHAYTDGWCSIFSGVDCGGYRTETCYNCPYYDSNENLGQAYCNGECNWYCLDDGDDTTCVCDVR